MESSPVEIAARALCYAGKYSCTCSWQPPFKCVRTPHADDQDRAKVALAALEAAGFKIVGREPTPEMVEAWSAVFQPWPYQNNAWYALFDAAPLHLNKGEGE